MRQPYVTVVVPTLVGGAPLAECVRSLEAQTYPNADVIVVDNSGRGVARQTAPESTKVRIIANRTNVGFGAAINQAVRETRAERIAALNDDAVARPDWIERLVNAMEASRAGMCASRVLLNSDEMDSAGMLIAGDGSSKQRGHLTSPTTWDEPGESLAPSGSAALYHRDLFDVLGGFDESFFLYCEDTDLALRARWAGWTCRYVPEAIVEHRYSWSAGRASPLKAYYVERNRLFLVAKNFPLRLLALAPIYSALRYAWHLTYMVRGQGASGRFRQEGHGAASLPLLVVRAHLALLGSLPRLLRERRRILGSASCSVADFVQILRRHWISVQQVASL